MSRAAVFESLANDSALNGVGITSDSIFHNYSLEERPVATGPFIILRWGTEAPPYWQTVKAPESLQLWMHIPVEITEDFMTLKSYLDMCDNCLIAQQDVAGADNYTLSFVMIGGRSVDMKDDGYETISKNAAYNVFYRKS